MKNIRLSPIEGMLIRELEEAGEECIVTMLNTFFPRFPKMSKADFLITMSQSMRNLIERGLIGLSIDSKIPGLKSVPIEGAKVESYLRLPVMVFWNGQEKMWNWDTDSTGEYATSIILTEAGYKALTT